MAPDNMAAAKPTSKDESQSSGGGNGGCRKTTSQRPQEQPLTCPRCDSTNTKFCYYNNYSLTQPRYFCKTCRRYWTKGGALRNVPIGGGCRKNKKLKSSSKLSGDSKDSSTSSDIGGLGFFHGLSSPAIEFQLGGLNFSRLQPPPPPTSSSSGVYNQFPTFGDISSSSGAIGSTPCFTLDQSVTTSPLMGFNFSLPSLLKQGENSPSFGGVQEMGSINGHNSIASSIESLSSINQDLHLKLQQQRFAMLFGEENQKDHNNSVSSVHVENHHQIQKPQPILFQNLEMSKAEDSREEGMSSNNLETEWYFDNSTYAPVHPTPVDAAANAHESAPELLTASGDVSMSQVRHFPLHGVQAWNNLDPFSTLP